MCPISHRQIAFDQTFCQICPISQTLFDILTCKLDTLSNLKVQCDGFKLDNLSNKLDSFTNELDNFALLNYGKGIGLAAK